MIVGIFEAPLMCSCAGNLMKGEVPLNQNQIVVSMKGDYEPCYWFYLWYLAGIKDTGAHQDNLNIETVVMHTCRKCRCKLYQDRKRGLFYDEIHDKSRETTW
jgi:hypothetical protein